MLYHTSRFPFQLSSSFGGKERKQADSVRPTMDELVREIM